jgi:carboxymethylenebutenolidase
MTKRTSMLVLALVTAPALMIAADVVTFPSGGLTLRGVVFRPDGAGPFPAVVYNHGSAPGMRSKDAFDALGPVFAAHGWVFFGPYRRGQGLSASAGPYIGDEIDAAEKKGGTAAGAAALVRLLSTDHLQDQLAALAWLRTQRFVRPDRIAVAGNSFGGIEAVLGAERAAYCAAIDSAGGAQSWAQAPECSRCCCVQSEILKRRSFSSKPRTITTCRPARLSPTR